MSDMLFRPAQAAFQNAIDTGRLSETENAKYYAGKYMYMYSFFDSQSDLYIDEFKHIDTRAHFRVINETPPHIDILKEPPGGA